MVKHEITEEALHQSLTPYSVEEGMDNSSIIMGDDSAASWYPHSSSGDDDNPFAFTDSKDCPLFKKWLDLIKNYPASLNLEADDDIDVKPEKHEIFSSTESFRLCK